MTTYLVTGGAGFVGSNLALSLKRDRADTRVIALDNLKRRGSELALSRLAGGGVEFVHGDIRRPEDLDLAARIDCLIECSAEPSVQAGYHQSPEYVVQTNLAGALHCFELARRHGADVIFLSSSRVYPIATINGLSVTETPTRFQLSDTQSVAGASASGFNEQFPLEGSRSLYGATKLAAELILAEYLEMYGLRGVIDRCGVIAGPWQMGKVDQGVVSLWAARHVYGGNLNYVGFGGTGKQVRDVLHVDDLYQLIDIQLRQIDSLNGQVFNVGGGAAGTISLRELTHLCEKVTGSTISIGSVPGTHPSDVRLYISDCTKVRDLIGWTPRRDPVTIVEDVVRWIRDNQVQLKSVLG